MARPRRPPRDCLPGAGIACQAPLAHYIHPPRPPPPPALSFSPRLALDRAPPCSRSPPPSSIRCLFFQPLGGFLYPSSTTTRSLRPRSRPPSQSPSPLSLHRLAPASRIRFYRGVYACLLLRIFYIRFYFALRVFM